MKNNFKELFSAITNEPFHCFIDIERNLLLHQPNYLLKENKWQIVPNTNQGDILNKFYSQFPNGIEGTKQKCLELIKNY